MTDEILHVHHWHKRRIHCFDADPPKEEDLPFILCCCHCNKEMELEPEHIPWTKPSLELIQAEQAWRNVKPRHKEIDKLRKQEQKREFEAADATLRAYHERKKRKQNAHH